MSGFVFVDFFFPVLSQQKYRSSPLEILILSYVREIFSFAERAMSL